MLKRSFIFLTILIFQFSFLNSLRAQSYEITLRTEKMQDSMLYIGQHYRDEFVLMDSTMRRPDGSYLFKGKRAWKRGIYAFVRKDVNKKKKETKLVGLTDFAIDGNQKFTITADSAFRPQNMKVSGSEACRQMYDYMGRINEARAESKSLNERMKTADSAAARKEQEALGKKNGGIPG